MENFVNNGIISIGNNNNNTINHINYQVLLEELYILKDATNCDIDQLIEACKQKNSDKFFKGLKVLSKEAIHIIKELGLAFLVKMIENNL